MGNGKKRYPAARRYGEWQEAVSGSPAVWGMTRGGGSPAVSVWHDWLSGNQLFMRI